MIIIIKHKSYLDPCIILYLIQMSSLTKSKLVNLYKKENDPKVKERLLLIIKVRQDKQIPFRVVKEIHRSNPWASDWLKRYDKEGIDGLKDRTKAGRPPELSEETSYQIKQELSNSNQGWTTKQVEELIIMKSGIKYHYTHIYRILRKWGFKKKKPRKVHVNTVSAEEKDAFKKRSSKYLWKYNNNNNNSSSSRNMDLP